MTPKVKPSDLIKMSEAYGYLFGAPMNFKSVSEMAEFIQSIPMEMNDLMIRLKALLRFTKKYGQILIQRGLLIQQGNMDLISHKLFHFAAKVDLDKGEISIFSFGKEFPNLRK